MRWLGFSQADLEAIVDLGSAQTFSQAGVHTCVEKGDWVFDARGVEISISDDGEEPTVVRHDGLHGRIVEGGIVHGGDAAL